MTAMFTVREYKRALRLILPQMNEAHYTMLQAQYYAPNKTITAPQLAKAVGYSTFSAANLQYGKLGRLIATSLDRMPSIRTDGTYQWWKVLSSGKSNRDSGFQWTMHPELATALEELEIVTEAKFTLPEEIIDTKTLPEGAVHRVTVNAYERNAEARSICIAHYGTRCIVCNFDFEKTYGEVGAGYIHVHHLRALSEIREEYEVDPIRDLRPVCANCHAIIHKRVPPYSIREVQTILNR